MDDSTLLAEELDTISLQSIKEMKAAETMRVNRVISTELVQQARDKTSLNQRQVFKVSLFTQYLKGMRVGGGSAVEVCRGIDCHSTY